MKLASVLVAMCCLLSAASGEPDSLVQSIVNSVSQDSISATIQRLQDYGTRDAQSDSNLAVVQYARERMVGYSCDTVHLHHFDTVYGFGPSVIGVKQGRLHPDVEYIICGHIDATGPVEDSAPGADDNASGTSVVLEACRVLASHWFNYTVRFICFNAEEHGGMGAAWYASDARLRGDSILGVLNFDMVGYGPAGRDSVFVAGKVADPDCRELLGDFCASAEAYTDLKYFALPVTGGFIGYDHYHFWVQGYPALLVEEVELTPEKHGVGDTLGPYLYEQCGVNNLPMCTEVTRAAVATLATIAQVDGIAGVSECRQPALFPAEPVATVARGVLYLPEASSHKPRAASYLLDISGRKVLNLHPGANDVSQLSAGVYFMRGEAQASSQKPQAVTIRKVVVQH